MVATPSPPQAQSLRLQTKSTFEQNRAALKTIRDALGTYAHPGADGGPWELVLAEVLNNVVEHAYSEQPEGVIELSVSWTPDMLTATVIDDGKPMPGGKVPGSADSLADIDPETHPEGGFGWGLIHTLTRSITYHRKDNRNHLQFEIAIDGT